MEAIAHFFDEALMLGGTWIVRLGNISKDVYYRLRREELYGAELFFRLPHDFIEDVEDVTEVVPLDQLVLGFNLAMEGAQVIENQLVLLLGGLLAEQVTPQCSTDGTVEVESGQFVRTALRRVLFAVQRRLSIRIQRCEQT